MVERAKERWSASADRWTRLTGDMRPSVLIDLTGALERAASMSMAQMQALPSRCQCGRCGPEQRYKHRADWRGFKRHYEARCSVCCIRGARAGFL
jgi:hypothetical protein